jgi:hypothetical protein
LEGRLALVLTSVVLNFITPLSVAIVIGFVVRLEFFNLFSGFLTAASI